MNLDFFVALPEIVLLAGACALMLVDLQVKGEDRRATWMLAQVLLLACAAATVVVLFGSLTGEAALGEAGAVAVITAYNRLFVADLMSHVLKLAAYGAVSLMLVYSRQYLLDRGLLRGEFVSLLLFALLGIMIMASANSFLTLYLGLELLSLCLYAMVALNRDSAASTEAAMKYFVLGALASGMLLYGMSMIYGATGSLELPEIARQIAKLSKDGTQHTFLVFGLVFVVCGVAFKLGVVPFHMWIPDVYHGAPTAVTLLIGTAPKLAAFAMAMRLLVNGLLDLAADWQQMLAILAVLSMALGNIAAIAQANLKRMLAYSTIAHMGFMLLGLLSGVVGGNWLNAADAYAAAMFYTLIYVLMSAGAFGMLVFLSRKGYECETLEDMKGLNRRNPWYAFLMLVIMFSLAGVPPTAGFYAKLVVLSAAVNANQIWLAVAAVVFSVIGAYYYLRVVKLMYFDEPVDAAAAPAFDAQTRGMRVLLSANGLALLVLGLLPQALMDLCFSAIKNL
ncbi:MAG: NADH-quinone oxidoreductase subunit NuoN [Burkholderiales bacterium]|nr:NADH-quinone oxidoreductase subunit NuoN [Burkholderiales bacterium]